MQQSENGIERELQLLLSDERARCNQYKQIYQTLKDKHAKLQEELTSIYQQLKESVAQNEQLKLSNETYISKLEEAVREKQKEIQALNSKIKSFNPVQIRETVLEEASKHYDAKVKELQAEIDRNREQYNNLHFNHTILKCQLESQASDHSRIVEQIKFQYHGEVEHLNEKIEALVKEKSSPSSDYVLELKNAQHENLQLTSKMKVLLSECEELRAQNENLTLQVNSLNRTHSKQLAENSTNIRDLESEKLKISMKRDVLEKELANYQEHRKMLNSELQSNRQEVFTLRSKIEECEHKCRMATTNLQVELERQKADLEAERDELTDEVTHLKGELHSTKDELSCEKQSSLEKEKSFQQTLLSNKHQIWKTCTDLEQERENLQCKLRDLELSKNEIIAEMRQDLQATQETLHLTKESKVEIEKSFVAIKQKLEDAQKDNEIQNYDVLLKQNQDYERQIMSLNQKIDSLTARNDIFFAQKETSNNLTYQNKCEDYCNSNDRQEILQLKLGWEQQKLQFTQRLDELEWHLKESKTASATQKKEMEYKLKQYAKLINKLRRKLDVQKAQFEELKVENDVLRKNIPPDIHSNVKKQLLELQRRLEEYRQVIAIEPKFTFLSNMGLDSLTEGIFQGKTSLQNKIHIPKLNPTVESDELFNPQPQSKVKEVSPSIQARRPSRPRRRSLKIRDRDREASKAGISPIISSSSELENL